eukprot:gene7376-7438_t
MPERSARKSWRASSIVRIGIRLPAREIAIVQSNLAHRTRVLARIGGILAFACAAFSAAAQSLPADIQLRGTPADTATPSDPSILPPVKPKRPPKLPALVPYSSYPPSLAEQKAARLRNGPARPLATTGLPPLENAAGTTKPVKSYQPDLTPPPTAAVVPTLPKAGSAPQTLGPYDPTGINAGSLRLLPYVETDAGFQANPASLPNPGKGSAFLRSEFGTTINSTTSSNDFSAQLRAGYTDFLSDHSNNHPDLKATILDKITVTRDTIVSLESHASYTTQRSTATDLAGNTATAASGVYDYGAAAGVTQTFGRGSVNLRGALNRNTYDSVDLASGTILALNKQNYNSYELRSRVGYEITPGITPFVQATVDAHKYDSLADISGYERSSTGQKLVVGTTFELSRSLTADVNAGVQHRNYQDTRLPAVTRAVGEANLGWQMTPLTKFSVKASSSVDETSLAGSSGIMDSRISGQIDHALLRNLTLTGLGSFQFNHYICGCQDDHIYSGSIAADYALSRNLVLKGSYIFTQQISTNPASRYVDNVFMLGLKLQR